MLEVVQNLWQIIVLLGDVLVGVLWLAIRWSPLVGWVAFWLWAADWRKLGPALAKGAWGPVVLLALMSALIWAALVPSEWHLTGGVALPNYLWQLIAVAALLGLAGFCGWLQIMFRWSPKEIDLAPAAATHDHHHGHGH